MTVVLAASLAVVATSSACIVGCSQNNCGGPSPIATEVFVQNAKTGQPICDAGVLVLGTDLPDGGTQLVGFTPGGAGCQYGLAQRNACGEVLSVYSLDTIGVYTVYVSEPGFADASANATVHFYCGGQAPPPNVVTVSLQPN